MEYCSWCNSKGSKLSRCSRCRNSRYCGRSCLKRHWGHGHSMLCGVVFDRSKQFGSAPIVTARPAIAEFKKSDLDASWRCREYVPAALSGVETRPLSDKAIWLANSSHSSRDTQRGDICARRLQRRLITLGVQSDLDTTVTWLQENRGKDAYALAMLYSNESCGRLDFAKVVNNYARAHKGGDRRVTPESWPTKDI